MSAPDGSRNSQSYPSRNPRRRQRKESEEGGSLRQQPLRKRSKLSKESYQPKPVAVVNGNSPALHTNGHISDDESDPAPSLQSLSINSREKRSGANVKRGMKDDGSLTLTKNANYTVKHLPSLPNQLRNDKSGTFRGSFKPSTRYALALTREHALIWDCSTSNPVPATRSFKLPYQSKENEPKPVGSLVTIGSVHETGLVVVAPAAGKVTFWENIENADALSLFEERRNGIEAPINGLFSGETVIDIEDADHAGFLLTFSTGRVAQLTLRDSQSRPSISVQFLRDPKENSSRSLFGGLKTIFGVGGWLKDVVATKSRLSQQRGQTEVIVSDRNGYFQLWELSWSGPAMLKAQVDARQELKSALKASLEERAENSSSETIVLDFEFLSDATSLDKAHSSSSAQQLVNLIVLAGIAGSNSSLIALVEIRGTIGNPIAHRTIPLRSYAAPLISKSSWRPKLCLPKPRNTAFVVFEQAVVIVSLGTLAASPETQHFEDSRALPEPFQDTVYLREDEDLYVVGVDVDNYYDSKRSYSAILVLIKGFGVARIIANEFGTEAGLASGRIPVKSRIEQAIFYGSKQSNPLNLSRKPEVNYAMEDVESAALDISGQILRSSSDFIPPISHSTEHHLDLRNTALRNLALQLKSNYPRTSRLTRWRLRWDAEKMAAALAIWRLFDLRFERGPFPETSLLPILISYLHERYKSSATGTAELDPVRRWFVHDVGRLEVVLPWAFQTVSEIYKENLTKDPLQVLELTSQADDLVLGALETAFEFRQENAELYGLEHELLKEGVLQSGYDDLPEFWTSTQNVVARNHLLVNLSRELAWEYTETKAQNKPIPPVAKKVAKENVRLVQMSCQSYDERNRWYAVQAAENQGLSDTFQETFDQARFDMITGLTKVGMVQDGMVLAEKYQDMESLVFLVAEEWDFLIASFEEPGGPENIVASAGVQLNDLQDRIAEYFEKFGSAWRDAYFAKHIRDGRLNTLLDTASRFQPQVTQFLREDGSRAKLSWINDILGETDYMRGGQTLLENVALTEQNLWSKKVELSIAKLSLLAAKNKQDSHEIASDEQKNEAAVKLIDIQEKILYHIRPNLYNAMDQAAELQLAMDSFGNVVVQDRSAMQQLLERAFEDLLNQLALDPDQLIDLLTLMDSKPSDLKVDNIAGEEFCLALQVLQHSGLHQSDNTRHEMLLKTIWRRCLIRDDWDDLNRTKSKTDEEVQVGLASTMLFKTFYAGATTGMFDSTSTVQPPSPIACLGAGSNADDHRYRFHNADLRGPVAHDMAIEDQKLQHYVEHCRLEYWVSSCREWASESFSAAMDYETERREKAQRVTEEIWEEDEDLRLAGMRGPPATPGFEW